MPTTPRWGGLRPEPYDSNARDADGDGIVQEGTAFERPAGTRLISFFGEAPNDGDITLDRDTDWRVVDESGQVVDYTPSYGAADEAPLPKTLSESVGTIGSRTGTVGDQQETIGNRGTLENIVGTISKPPTPLPPPRREREVAPEAAPTPAIISEAARARLPEGYVPGEIKPEMMMDFLTRVREKTISLEADHLNELSDLLRDAGYGYEDRMAIVARFRSEPEFRKIIDDSIERETESLRQELASAFEAPLVINIPEFFIPALMETGRYKTQFETGKSGGIFNPGMRSAVEKTQMGVDPTIAPDMRPVYGSADQQIAGQGADVGELYGDTKLHLKDSVKERATLTIGDSLGDGQFPVAYRSDLPVDRVLAATSRWESNPVRRRTALRGAILDALNDENLPDEVRQYIQRTPEAFQKQDDFPPAPGAYYIESQIHGQVKLEDIDFVELPEGGDPDNVERAKEALDRAGIRWKHEGMESAPRQAATPESQTPIEVEPDASRITEVVPATATPAPRSPRLAPASKRSQEYTSMAANPEEVDELREQLVADLMDTYLSEDEKSLPVVDRLRLIPDRMGITLDAPVDELLDEALLQFQEDGGYIDQIVAKLSRVTPGSPRYNRTMELIRQVQEAKLLTGTEDGRQLLRDRMAQGFINSLAAQEDMYKEFPNMRANIIMGIIESDSNHLGSGAYASTVIDENGMPATRYRIGSHALVLSSFDDDLMESGDVFNDTVRVVGTDSYQVTLASHELGHNAHMIAAWSRLGIKPSKTESIVDQLKQYGPLLEDTFVGQKLARKLNVDPSTPLDSLTNEQLNVLYADIKMAYRDAANAQNPIAGLNHITPTGLMTGGAGEVIRLVANGETFDPNNWGGVPPELQTPEGLSAFVTRKLGMPLDEFAVQLRESVKRDTGVDPVLVGTNGLSVQDVASNLGTISEYGSTVWTEGVAETFSLLFLKKRLSSLQIDDASAQRYDSTMGAILEGILAEVRQQRLSDETKQLYRRMHELVNDPIFSSFKKLGSVS